MMLTKTPSRFQSKENISGFDNTVLGINKISSKKSPAPVKSIFTEYGNNYGDGLLQGCHEAHILSLIFEGLS